MSYQNLLTGANSSTFPFTARNGEWVVTAPVRLNGTAFQPGAALLAGPNGTITGEFGQANWKEHAPSEPELLRLRSISTFCLAAIGQPGALWATLPPVSPDLGDTVELLPVERLLAQSVSSLRSICADPRMSLQSQDLRLPVSRVQRTSRRALTHLAAHPEDWLQPSAHGVRPARLLAAVRRDVLDIYENRVTANLVDYLERHLTERISALGRLRVRIQRISNYVDEANQGTYARQGRLYRLWSELGLQGPQVYLTRLDTVLQTLRRLRKQVGACQHSPLYCALRTYRTERQLRVTNIFQSEPRYKQVARLWHALEARPDLGRSASELAQQVQELNQGFAAYVVLLTVRALGQLGYTCGEGQRVAPGSQSTWEAGNDRLFLTWNRDGTQSLATDRGPLLKIVPLMSTKLPLTPVSGGEVPVVVVHFDPEGETVTLPPLLTPKHMLARLGADPNDLQSTERMARVLTSVTLGRRLAEYPVRVPPLGPTVPHWAHARGHHWVLHRPLTPAELTVLPTALSALPKRENTRPSRAEQLQIQQHEERLSLFQAAAHQLDALARCPQCSNADVQFEGRDDDAFAASCGECHAQWGLRKCASCPTRYPYFLPALDHWPDPAEAPTSWPDDQFGMDLLTLPVLASRGRHFQCPSCTPVA